MCSQSTSRFSKRMTVHHSRTLFRLLRMKRIQHRTGDQVGNMVFESYAPSSGGRRRACFTCPCGNRFDSFIKVKLGQVDFRQPA
jgi:hypothetical protein